jgi:hypothetical protein
MRNPEVDVWFEKKKHPLEAAMQEVRELALGADPRITEAIKWSTKLLDEGLIDYVASDVHRVDHLNIIKETTLPSSVLKHIIPVINNTIETFY